MIVITESWISKVLPWYLLLEYDGGCYGCCWKFIFSMYIRYFSFSLITRSYLDNMLISLFFFRKTLNDDLHFCNFFPYIEPTQLPFQHSHCSLKTFTIHSYIPIDMVSWLSRTISLSKCYLHHRKWILAWLNVTSKRFASPSWSRRYTTPNMSFRFRAWISIFKVASSK